MATGPCMDSLAVGVSHHSHIAGLLEVSPNNVKFFFEKRVFATRLRVCLLSFCKFLQINYFRTSLTHSINNWFSVSRLLNSNGTSQKD